MKQILLAGILVFSLALCGCGGPPSAASAPPEKAGTAETLFTAGTPIETVQSDPASREENTEAGKVLVVYYSATGSTEAVAGYIADTLGGGTFSITPAEPYTSEDLNWTNAQSRVSREHDDPALRTIELTETTPENWDSYETVFIGYPIWWGIAAWPVDNFITANDFTGKTVIPFCTSSSSGLGQSGELLAELAGTGEWLDGMRFRSGASEDSVREWALELGIAG